MTKKTKAITGKEFNKKMQDKFDATIQRAVNVVSPLIDECLIEFTSVQLSNYMGELPRINLYTKLEDDYDAHDEGVFKWSNKIGVINRKENTFQPDNDLFDGILQAIKEKYDGFDISCEHDSRAQENTLVFDSKFKPCKLVTAVDFGVAWEKSRQEMIDFFVNHVLSAVQDNCGKRSCEGIIPVNDVCYDQPLSFSLDEGAEIDLEVRQRIKERGFEVNFSAPRIDANILYPNIYYDVELRIAESEK